MLLLRLQLILRFLRSSSLLTHIGETANFDCTKTSFSITISNTSHHIFVALRIKPAFFDFYFPSYISQSFNWGFPMKQFCDHLRHGIEYSSMCFAIFEQNPPCAIFEFYNSYTPNQELPALSRQIRLSSPENQVDVGTIDYAAFLSLDSQRFRYILNMFRNVEKVDVTMMASQVIFRSPGRTMILNTEDKQCIIGGIGAGKELGFPISLNPTPFFYDLTMNVDRVWLYLTTKGVSVICAPIDLNVRIETYFFHLNS